MTLSATFIAPLVIAAYAAYAFTFMQFRGRDVLLTVIVGLLVIPVQVALLPLLRIYGQLRLTGTFTAVWLAHIGFGMPLVIYILRSFMTRLPRATIESAMIDGAGHFTTFWRLVVPDVGPGTGVLRDLPVPLGMDDLLVALVFLGSGDDSVVRPHGANGTIDQPRLVVLVRSSSTLAITSSGSSGRVGASRLLPASSNHSLTAVASSATSSSPSSSPAVLTYCSIQESSIRTLMCG